MENISFIINEDETLDDLQYNNLFIIQKRKAFRFGTDPVLLANFTKVKNNEKICDFGTGTGILSILLSQKAQGVKISAFEIQDTMADMAKRSVLHNDLDSMIEIYNYDFCDAYKYIGIGSQDLVICNPPYGKENSTVVNSNESIGLSKHEGSTLINKTIRSINKVLRYGGRLTICFPCERLIELINVLQNNSLEPKIIRFVHSNINKQAYLVLLEAAKGGKQGINIMPPLIINNADGGESDEIKHIYHRE